VVAAEHLVGRKPSGRGAVTRCRLLFWLWDSDTGLFF